MKLRLRYNWALGRFLKWVPEFKCWLELDEQVVGEMVEQYPNPPKIPVERMKLGLGCIQNDTIMDIFRGADSLYSDKILKSLKAKGLLLKNTLKPELTHKGFKYAGSFNQWMY